MEQHFQHIQAKIVGLDALQQRVNRWKDAGQKVVFTNGCFDILHAGHVNYLAAAADLGDKLIIGLNADTSLKKLKGERRPIIPQDQRALLLAALEFVDAVVLFEEDTPLQLIRTLAPDVLAKGGDYTIDTIVGAEDVQQNGGEVKVITFVDGLSTSKIIEKIRNS